MRQRLVSTTTTYFFEPNKLNEIKDKDMKVKMRGDTPDEEGVFTSFGIENDDVR